MWRSPGLRCRWGKEGEQKGEPHRGDCGVEGVFCLCYGEVGCLGKENLVTQIEGHGGGGRFTSEWSQRAVCDMDPKMRLVSSALGVRESLQSREHRPVTFLVTVTELLTSN